MNNLWKKIKYKCIYTIVLLTLQGKGICLQHSKIMAQQIAWFKVYG